MLIKDLRLFLKTEKVPWLVDEISHLPLTPTSKNFDLLEKYQAISIKTISLNQICMAGLFTQREPLSQSCWHWRACVLLWLQKPKGLCRGSAVLPPRRSVCPSPVATKADIAVVHRGLNRASTSMWCLIKSFLGKYCGTIQKNGYVGGIIGVFIFTFKPLFWVETTVCWGC